MVALTHWLGTGTAFPRHSYNTCFVLRTAGGLLLVDGGGGAEVLARLDSAGIGIADIAHIFVTHSHTDHIFGVVWLLRRSLHLAFDGALEGHIIKVYGNAATIAALSEICRLTLLPAYIARLEQTVEFIAVAPGDTATIGDMELRFIDCRSTGVDQTGFRAVLPSGKSLVCLGDESLSEANAADAEGADWLICGAFCRYADRHIFHPYEKHHLTVADIARTAAEARVANLILVHCEDHDLENRSMLYADEAAQYFAGGVAVPRDGQTVELA